MAKKRNPVAATVFSMGAFIATSAAFNLIFLIAAWIGIDRFLGSVLQGIALLAICLLLGPLSFQAEKSTRPRLVAFMASLLLGGGYFAAVRFHIVFVTHGLFPRIPGKEVRADTSTAMVGLLILIAVFIFVATSISGPRKRSGHGDAGDEAIELGTEVGEGVGEGIIEQIRHLHHH